MSEAAATVEIADALFCREHLKEVVRRYLSLPTLLQVCLGG